MMQDTQTSLQTQDGLELFAQSWQPEETTGAVIAIVHGIGEYCGRYMNLVNYLVPRGHTLCGFDLRGQGRSPGQRGHVDSFEDYREDLGEFLVWVRTWAADRPRFLLGHSFGSLVALDYVLRDASGLEGVIISSSALDPVGVASPMLVRIARLFSRVWPRFSLSTPLVTDALSRDPEVVEAYENDPLVHDKATARFGTESLDTIEWIKAHASDMQLPLLMIHGGEDRINSVEGTRSFFEAVSSTDKELIIYPDTYHEPHNDLNSQEVASDIGRWVEKRL